ncbi:LTA synthase family protein [Propionicicella superfundia]|uniref:LTA synthase family protein n=1 Tax=Propionicicella superfundia TaxID=348582 RepID=UPI0004028945|nr:LTA synthase family protein [Propionicicella superfundia]
MLSTLALVLLATAWWINFRFGSVILEQVLLNLPITGGEGVGNDRLVIEAAVVCIGLPVLVVSLVAVARRLIRRARGHRPPPVKTAVRRPLVATGLAFAVSLAVLLSVTGVPQYAVAILSDRTFAAYYATPAVAAEAKEPRNLITIYLESMENTFSDASIFGRDLLSGLDDATSGWEVYDGLEQYPSGGWTMAGIVGTQCGIPLKSKLLVDGVNPNDFGEKVTTYLPGATCLGDVLSEEGYTNVFLGGADSRFAGKGTFLSDHGYDQILGREVWEAAGEDEEDISVWGLSDRRLLEHARETVSELRASDTPYNLTIFTLDTHEPGGVYPSCDTDDAVAMATAITCSMSAVADFLGYLEDEGVLDDTVVMLMGDHLKATSDGGAFKTELEGASDRTIVFRVSSPDPVAFDRPRTDQFSILPTTLELLGFSLVDGRAGLGVSLMGGHDLTDTALALPSDEYEATVTAPSSALYKEFWQD